MSNPLRVPGTLQPGSFQGSGWVFRGTDTGGYAGRAATGRAVEAWVVTIMHFDGDKVVREWIGADNLGLFIQLGIIDNPWPG